MRRASAIVSTMALAALACVVAPAAVAWRSEQPVSPELGVPVPLGPVGDVECWAANRCLLITGGTDAVGDDDRVLPGLFAYDGAGWYRLSTVCGGAEGRIAWAGPNEWWTISDQRAGQLQGSDAVNGRSRSLCHFRDGQVVASHAQPLGSIGGYLPLRAAACSGPSDCWFAGERLPGTVNEGAFHLHWDGEALREVPSLTIEQPDVAGFGRDVEHLAHHEGRLYESVQVRSDDLVGPNDSVSNPHLVHEILADSGSPFLPVLAASFDYGQPAASPPDLDAFRLASGGGGLWAVAGAVRAPAKLTALRLGQGRFEQLPLTAPAGLLGAGDVVRGLAAEPDTGAAWIALSKPGESPGSATAQARLVRVGVDGQVEQPVLLPAAADGIGRKGPAGPVACSAPEQCWMATTLGWLFHLGDPPPVNADPLFHRLIDFRPADNGVPFVPPDALPIDDSGATLPPGLGDSGATIAPDEPPSRPRRRTLVFQVRQRMVGRTTLRVSFRLRARARVQLVAKRRKRVVARTARRVFAPGRRGLRLRLDPRRWPTKLDLRASEVERRGASVTIHVTRHAP